MIGVTSRAAVALSLLLPLLLLTLMLLPHAGFGWGQSQLVRQALLDALQPLPAQPAPAPTFQGRTATADEAASLDATLKGFLEAARNRQSPRGWVYTGGTEVSPDQWSDRQVDTMDPTITVSASDLLMAATTMGVKTEIGEVSTSGKEGLARLTLTLAPRQSFMLIRREARWLIDLDATEQLLADTTTREQIKQASSGSLKQLYFTMMPDRALRLGSSVLDLLLAVPDLVQWQATTHEISADRALVTVEASAKVHLAVALERTISGWHLARNINPVLLKPETPLRDANLFTGGPGPKTQACLSNLRQLSQAMRLYVADYDGNFPRANQWSDAIGPYVTSPGYFSCPAVTDKYGYALNYKLSLLPLSKVTQPSTTAELFDSTILQPNAYDRDVAPGASVPNPGRHDRLISYAFVDGHVAFQASPLSQDFYRPTRSLPRESLTTIPAVRAPGGG